MRKNDLKGCNKGLNCSVQEQSIQTKYIKCNVDKTGKSPFVGCVVQKMRLYLT